jgi:hypothetical protein
MGRTADAPRGKRTPPARRASHARRGTRHAASQSRRERAPRRWRVGWARRLGIAGAILLAAVSVAMAAEALRPGPDRPPGDSPTATASADPLVAVAPPVLDQPVGVTAASTINLHGQLVGQLPGGGPFRVRVYVNDRFRADVKVSRSDTQFDVSGVPLEDGSNSITATISDGDAETAPSAPVAVERDTVAPKIDISSPADGATVYGETLLLSGTTEPGAQLSLTDRTTAAQTSTTAADNGAYSLSLPLQLGSNVLQLVAVDAVGNSSQRNLRITRAVSQAAVTLQLSRDSFDIATLPATLTVTADVAGPDGLPADGASVTFSVSPSGQATVTRQATTVGGVASWNDFPLSVAGAQAGRGLVTVLVTLADGETLAGSATFDYR